MEERGVQSELPTIQETGGGLFFVHFFVKKTTRGHFFLIKRFVQLAGNGGPPANVSVPTIMDALVMLYLEVKAMW